MKEYILDRVNKALYMGFILDKRSNDFLSKRPEVNIESMKKMIDNYNNSISKKGYPIEIASNDYNEYMEIRTLGKFVYLTNDEKNILIKNLQDRIMKNLRHSVKSYQEEGIEIFDLDLLVELKRTGVTTMGHTYSAFNQRKYYVNFFNIERISYATI